MILRPNLGADGQILHRAQAILGINQGIGTKADDALNLGERDGHALAKGIEIGQRAALIGGIAEGDVHIGGVQPRQIENIA